MTKARSLAVNSMMVLIFAIALTQVVVGTGGSRTFRVKGIINGPRHSRAAGVRVQFDAGEKYTVVTTDEKGSYTVELPIGSYTMSVHAPKTGNLTLSILRDYERPLFLVTSPRTVTLNGTLQYARPTCDLAVFGSRGQPSQEEQEAASKNACGGQDIFPVPSEDGVPFQIAVQYPRRELTDHGYLYKSDKIYETEPPVRVWMAYNLFSLEADRVNHISQDHMIAAAGNVVTADGSGKMHHFDSIGFTLKDGQAVPVKTERLPQTTGVPIRP